MTFWIIAAIIALVSAVALGVTAARARTGTGRAAEFDLRVYRDQLKEVDRDLARGVIVAADADRIRTEIGRRILAADAKAKSENTAAASAGASWPLLILLCAVLIGGGLWLYATIGQPGYGDLPRSLREDQAETLRQTRPSQAQAEADLPPLPPAPNLGAEYEALVVKLRETVATRPDDLQGQILLAQNEAQLGNFNAAHAAQSQVLRIKGDSADPQDYLYYADMLVLAAGGYISPEAEAALLETLKREPANGAALYYWGMMYAQTGRPDLAFRIWERLLAVSAPDRPWVPPIRAQIEEIAQLAGEHRFTLPPERALPGPSAEDMEAASDMSEEDRQDMIRNMVDGLAERLATEGGSAEEWARLIRALSVLGETEQVTAIWDDAQTVFAEDPASMELLTSAARAAGLIP